MDAIETGVEELPIHISSYTDGGEEDPEVVEVRSTNFNHPNIPLAVKEKWSVTICQVMVPYHPTPPFPFCLQGRS